MQPAPPSFVQHQWMPARQDMAAYSNAAEVKGSALVYLVIGCLFIPYSAAIYLGDLKLTPIKFLIVCLALPAAVKLIAAASRGQRSLLLSDACALGVFLQMSIAPVVISGSRDFVSAFSQAFEFYGMYVIGRAYVFDNASLRSLVAALQISTVVIVALGVSTSYFNAMSRKKPFGRYLPLPAAISTFPIPTFIGSYSASAA